MRNLQKKQSYNCFEQQSNWMSTKVFPPGALSTIKMEEMKKKKQSKKLQYVLKELVAIFPYFFSFPFPV